MSLFLNTLKIPDQVYDTELKRRGIVFANPRAGSRYVSVVFDGTKSPKRRDVMTLRYIVPGKKEHEEDPPIEGTPPPISEPVSRASSRTVFEDDDAPKDALQTLKDELAQHEGEIETMTTRAKLLRTRIEKLKSAIAVLAA